MSYTRPSLFHYRFTQCAAWLAATFVFGRKIKRNEIKGKKGPFVVIANHEAALDFVDLIGLTHRRMTFVISDSFYNTLPIEGFLKNLRLIPKQQFQTSAKDLKNIKSVVDAGEPVVIYPAGLMCEDGLSTPIPDATYKFLKWLDADIYVAKVTGTYFVMPKWGKGLRPGRTVVDVYKLFSKEELRGLDVCEVKERAKSALEFDAYREQDELRAKYLGNSVAGLEYVLYKCPNCGGEHTVRSRGKDTLYCESCGYEQVSDKWGMFENKKGIGPEYRYVSDWSRFVYGSLKEKMKSGACTGLVKNVTVKMMEHKKRRFVEAGRAQVSLDKDGFILKGTIRGEEREIAVPTVNVPSIPAKPGKYFDIQQGKEIYRCIPDEIGAVMPFAQMVEIFHELETEGE